jgi:hypothetical protein
LEHRFHGISSGVVAWNARIAICAVLLDDGKTVRCSLQTNPGDGIFRRAHAVGSLAHAHLKIFEIDGISSRRFRCLIFFGAP